MAGCTHFCVLLRQAQDKQKWNNLLLRNFNSLFSNAAFTNMYSISLFDIHLSIVNAEIMTSININFDVGIYMIWVRYHISLGFKYGYLYVLGITPGIMD